MSFSHDKRFCVYPCYINVNRKVSEGRKIAKEQACDNPTPMEIFECIANGLKLPAEVERKSHPRDWQIIGRVRVQIFDDDGKPLNPSIPNKHTLLVKIAELVPRHPGRSGKAKAAAQQQQQAASSAAAGSSKQAGKKSGKSGKKR